jgi:simple sugar transport system permease protein
VDGVGSVNAHVADRTDFLTIAKPVGITALRWLGAIGGALALFAVLLLAKGTDPLLVFGNVWNFVLTDPASLEQILVKAAPFALAALAVVVPAKAGMVNVGGEGQVLMGAVAAAGAALMLSGMAGPLVIVAMFVAGALAGALWAGIAALLRLVVKVNEAVSTLLLNYIALDVLLFLIYQPWKDPHGSGQPATSPLDGAATLPVFSGTKVHIGVLVALIAVPVVWAVLRWTSWGYRLSVVGGNPEAARRAGMPVGRLLLTTMLVGGALAGLAGVLHVAGVEYKLRPGFAVFIGYTGFLASWVGRHRPVAVLLAAAAFAAITVSGDSLQIDSGLPAATVNVLTGLVLIGVLGWTSKKGAS